MPSLPSSWPSLGILCLLTCFSCVITYHYSIIIFIPLFGIQPVYTAVCFISIQNLTNPALPPTALPWRTLGIPCVPDSQIKFRLISARLHMCAVVLR